MTALTLSTYLVNTPRSSRLALVAPDPKSIEETPGTLHEETTAKLLSSRGAEIPNPVPRAKHRRIVGYVESGPRCRAPSGRFLGRNAIFRGLRVQSPHPSGSESADRVTPSDPRRVPAPGLRKNPSGPRGPTKLSASR